MHCVSRFTFTGCVSRFTFIGCVSRFTFVGCVSRFTFTDCDFRFMFIVAFVYHIYFRGFRGESQNLCKLYRFARHKTPMINYTKHTEMRRLSLD